MLFLLPGRHAGEGGDVAEICQDMVSREAYLHMSTQQAQKAVQLCIDIIAGRVDIHQLNHQSLVCRGKPR